MKQITAIIQPHMRSKEERALPPSSKKEKHA
jgi:hypothetical protein